MVKDRGLGRRKGWGEEIIRQKSKTKRTRLRSRRRKDISRKVKDILNIGNCAESTDGEKGIEDEERGR